MTIYFPSVTNTCSAVSCVLLDGAVEEHELYFLDVVHISSHLSSYQALLLMGQYLNVRPVAGIVGSSFTNNLVFVVSE